MTGWLLRNARLADDAGLVDLRLAAGQIATIETAPLTAEPGEQVWDLQGRVVLPGLIEAHTHLDKTYLPTPNRSGTLGEAIATWRRSKLDRSPSLLKAAAEHGLRTAIAHGVTALRTHVDVELPSDLAAVTALLELREQYRAGLDLQLVALGAPGLSAASTAVVEEALRLGVDLVGAAPAITPDPTGVIDAVFALAERFDRPVDLHVDETEDPACCTLSTVAARTLTHGMAGRVTVGHCCSLAFMDDRVAGAVIEQVARARLHVVTLPLCNLVLMGRSHRPTPRGVTRVRELLAAGVPVAAGSDNVQDVFNPFGSYDPLAAAALTAQAAHLTAEAELYAALDFVTTNAAAALGLHTPQVRAGAPADLVVLDATRVIDAVLDPPPRLATFKAGRRLVHTTISRTWSEDLPLPSGEPQL